MAASAHWKPTVNSNEAAMGGRPKSDGPDTVEELMRNTRNNPLEDLGMHLPLICDRYELRDDVMPGAGKFRGGQGVVKSQRFLTPGFVTHESDRHGVDRQHDEASGEAAL